MRGGTSAEDAALQAAYDANDAFNRLQEAAEGIAALERVGRLSLGVVIPDSAYYTLEQRRTQASHDFMAFQDLVTFRDLTALFMRQQIESRAPETVIANLGAIARTRAEVVTFAKWRGYNPGAANTAFGYLWRNAWSNSPTTTEVVEVSDLETYELRVSDEPSSEASGKVIMISTSANAAKKKHPREPSNSDAFDIRTLHHMVVEWQSTDYLTDIRGLSEVGVSLFADYLNHALPGIQPLPVTSPPAKK